MVMSTLEHELEAHLLALGPLPRGGEPPWDTAQWMRYANLVQALAAQLSHRDAPPKDVTTATRRAYVDAVTTR
jgi:hypothetical protein